MASLDYFFRHIKPSMDTFLRSPNKEHIQNLEKELESFQDWDIKIYHVQILMPLVLKLEELNGVNMEICSHIMNCIKKVLSKIHLSDVKGLNTILIIVLKQTRDFESGTMKPNLSEEIKLACVECVSKALLRSTGDVLEKFYVHTSGTLLGQILLMLVQILESEKYRALIHAALVCLTVVFYIHDNANRNDIVLRKQVADTTFMYLPKILAVLSKIILGDEKLGELARILSIKALGRILVLMYEENREATLTDSNYERQEFKMLVTAFEANESSEEEYDLMLLKRKYSQEQLQERLEQLKTDGRSPKWMKATMSKLQAVFQRMGVLRSHVSVRTRYEYTIMCVDLLESCGRNLGACYVTLLQNVIALSEDEDTDIRTRCSNTLKTLQDDVLSESLFEETVFKLLDNHYVQMSSIIFRANETEQNAELLLLKGLLRSMSGKALNSFLSLTTNLESFCFNLITMIELKLPANILTEDWGLRQFDAKAMDECCKLPWRQYKHVQSMRCIHTIEDICRLLSSRKSALQLILDYLMDLLAQEHRSMNEIILLVLWLVEHNAAGHMLHMENFMEYILSERHWQLALRPDEVTRFKATKHSEWFSDRTPGLFESGVEVRIQDCDDFQEVDDSKENYRVDVADVRFNVLHTCLILDALGHCAKSLQSKLSPYIFRILHRVLLKIANNNTMIFQAAFFCFNCMQEALGFNNPGQFIESNVDYLSYHLNMALREDSEDSSTAVEVLTAILQLSSQKSLPYLENLFHTIQSECGRRDRTRNIASYLKVFNSFFLHLAQWQEQSEAEINKKCHTERHEISSYETSEGLLKNWLNILESSDAINEGFEDSKKAEDGSAIPHKKADDEPGDTHKETDEVEEAPTKNELPRHITMTKEILSQVLKSVSSTDKSQQILALECLISGLPLLKDYEDELLPQVHLIWQPLMEKFRQQDPVVLNRCFTLLMVLSKYAKEFILKRSLDDVIPYLRLFLKTTAVNSAKEHNLAKTQEYKLQLKLLQDFQHLIVDLQIDAKPLSEICDVISLYLSKRQPKELQHCAIECFDDLLRYNGPLVYVTIIKKSHIREYQENVANILEKIGLGPK